MNIKISSQINLRLTIELEQLAEEREATLAPIESNLLQVYEDLRQQKTRRSSDRSQATIPALHAAQPLNAALQQNARSQKQLAYCSSCGRILYAN